VIKTNNFQPYGNLFIM